MKMLCAISFLVITFACKDNKRLPEPSLYILSKEDSISAARHPDYPPLIKGFYSKFNVLIDTSDRVYFHSKNIERMCGTGVSFNKPDFLGLRPSNILVINPDYLLEFLEDNLISDRDEENYIYLASPVDSIRQRSFFKIIEYLRNVKYPYYLVRRITEEEQYVLEAKKNHKTYYPFDIKWKIGFDNLPDK